MNMRKIVLAAAAALSVVFGAFAEAPLTWTDPDTGFTWRYRATSSGAEICGYDDGWEVLPAVSPAPEGELVIPDHIGDGAGAAYLIVTSIGEWTFHDCVKVTSVRIPASVESIHRLSLRYLVKCDRFEIERTPASVGSFVSVNGALYTADQTELVFHPRHSQSFLLPQSVKIIGDYACNGIQGIATLAIPEGVEEIGEYAFDQSPEVSMWYFDCDIDDKDKITSLTLPSTLKRIGSNAFLSTAIKGVQIPAATTEIGFFAFHGASFGTFGVKQGNRTFSARDGVLYSADGKELVCWPMNHGFGDEEAAVVPEGVTTVRPYAFRNCRFKSLTMPSTLTTLYKDSFDSLYYVKSLYLPKSVTTILPRGGGERTWDDYGILYDCYRESLATIWVDVGDIDRMYGLLTDVGGYTGGKDRLRELGDEDPNASNFYMNGVSILEEKEGNGWEYDEDWNTLLIYGSDEDLVLSGTGSVEVVIMESGCELTLDHVKMFYSGNPAISVNEECILTLSLIGENCLVGDPRRSLSPAIRTSWGSVLSISQKYLYDENHELIPQTEDAVLRITGNNSAPGIGGDFGEDAGTIKINSGKLFVDVSTPYASDWQRATAAGIGCNGEGSTCEIELWGGNVNVATVSQGAGIGGGAGSTNVTVTMYGGKVYADTVHGPALGCGAGSKEGDLIIHGGEVTAESSDSVVIGGGDGADVDVIIEGGVINARQGTGTDGEVRAVLGTHGMVEQLVCIWIRGGRLDLAGSTFALGDRYIEDGINYDIRGGTVIAHSNDANLFDPDQPDLSTDSGLIYLGPDFEIHGGNVIARVPASDPSELYMGRGRTAWECGSRPVYRVKVVLAKDGPVTLTGLVGLPTCDYSYGTNDMETVAKTLMLWLPQRDEAYSFSVNGAACSATVSGKDVTATDNSKVKVLIRSSGSKYGTVSGGGSFAPGKTITLSATAKTGYYFAGWFADSACKKPLTVNSGYTYLDPKVKYTVPDKNVTIYTKFVTKAEDKKGLKFPSTMTSLAKSGCSISYATEPKLTIKVTSLTRPSFTATGLPDGLSIDKKTGLISGTSTAVGSHSVKVTVKTAAGNSLSLSFTMKVKELASKFTGTFSGYATANGHPAVVNLSVLGDGKVLGTVTGAAKGWTLTGKISSVSSTQAKFTGKIKIGSTTYKPVFTLKSGKGSDGTQFTKMTAQDVRKLKGFLAAKKLNLVKKGAKLAELVDRSYGYTLSTAYAVSTRNDKVTIKFLSGDRAQLSGKANGKRLAKTTVDLVIPDATVSGSYYLYQVAAPFVEKTAGYERLVAFTVKVNKSTGKLGKVTAVFGDFK